MTSSTMLRVNIRKVNKYMDRQAGGRDQDRVLASERSSASLETPENTRGILTTSNDVTANQSLSSNGFLPPLKPLPKAETY
jgi:hypothetical protein